MVLTNKRKSKLQDAETINLRQVRDVTRKGKIKKTPDET